MSWRETVKEQIAGREDRVMRVDYPKVEGLDVVWLVARMVMSGPAGFP